MKNQLLALALMAAGFASCTDDSYDLDNISNDFRIGLNEYLPIASSEVKLKDILSEFKTDYISEDSDGVLTFKFDTVNRVQVKPIEVAFKNNVFEYDLSSSGTLTLENSAIPGNNFRALSISFPVNMSIDDASGKGRIKEIHVKDGYFRFHIESENVDVSNLYIREINVGKLLDIHDGTTIYSLSNEIFVFPEDGLMLTCVVDVLDKSKNIQIKGNDAKIKIVMEESKLTYHKIKGSFKSNVEQIEYTDFYINLFDDNLISGLKVVDPKLTIIGVSNSGIPLACSVKSLVGKHKTKNSSKKDSIVAIFKDYKNGLPENDFKSKSYGFDFNPSTDGNDTTAFKETFDKDNGTLDELFNYLPDSVSVKCGIRINADPESGISYFLLDSTYVDLNIQAEVPLQIGNGSFITIKDTVDGIDIVEDVTDYQEGNFKFDDVEIFIEFENALPLEGTVIAKFCRADTINGEVVLTHLENTKLDQTVKIPAAKIGTDGWITKATPSKKKIVVSDDMVEDIKKINAVDFTYKINVPKGAVDGVVLTKDCGMSAKVYSHLKANISNKEK